MNIELKKYAIPTLNPNEFPGCIAARVTAVHRERFEIVCEYGFGHARMKRGLRLNADEMPTVGDYLAIDYNPGGDSTGLAVLPRRTLFARMDSWRGTRQLVAANIDLVCIVTSLNQEFNVRRLERYLAMARESGAKIAFLLTKLDLVASAEPMIEAVRTLTPDCPMLAISTFSGVGLDTLREWLPTGTTAALLGSSGVGKSSLVNALMGETRMDTGAIRSDDDRGRHTTVHRQMLELPWGALLIDTPGMRQMGMWDAADSVNDVFAEIAQAAQMCRYRDCTHTHEPGCAVREGMENGTLDPGRVRNYLAMHQEADVTAQRARKAEKMKEISRFSKEMKKHKR